MARPLDSPPSPSLPQREEFDDGVACIHGGFKSGLLLERRRRCSRAPRYYGARVCVVSLEDAYLSFLSAAMHNRSSVWVFHWNLNLGMQNTIHDVFCVLGGRWRQS